METDVSAGINGEPIAAAGLLDHTFQVLIPELARMIASLMMWG
jgi:hypothetical protein